MMTGPRAVCALLLVAGCATAPTTGRPQPFSAQTIPLRFENADAVIPGPFEIGVWAEIEAVLHRRADMTMIRLAIADSIIAEDNRELLWGVYAVVDWTDGRYPTVVVDRLVRWSTRVWSHEFCHVIGGFADGDYLLNACTLWDGPYELPVRPLTHEAQGAA